MIIPPRFRAGRRSGSGRRSGPGRARMRWLAAIVVAAAVVLVAALPRYAPARAGVAAHPGAAQQPGSAPMPFRATTVSVPGDTFLSWALMDRRTGAVWGSDTMARTSWTASMIKAWLAADYLRRATDNGQPPSAAMLHTIEIMIRDSDNAAASQIYALNGGEESIDRLVRLCGLTDSSANPAGWGVTNLSARDAVRLGDCIASGKGAGPQWTEWLLGMMRQVRGVSNFGIRDVLPAREASRVAVKNGYENFSDDGLFHVNCLAIGDTWTMAVMQRYRPAHGWDADLARGEAGCRQVATQLLASTG